MPNIGKDIYQLELLCCLYTHANILEIHWEYLMKLRMCVPCAQQLHYPLSCIYRCTKTHATMFKQHYSSGVEWIILIVLYSIMENYSMMRMNKLSLHTTKRLNLKTKCSAENLGTQEYIHI